MTKWNVNIVRGNNWGTRGWKDWALLLFAGFLILAFIVAMLTMLAAGFLWALSVFGIATFPIDFVHIFAFWVLFIIASSLFRGLLSVRTG